MRLTKRATTVAFGRYQSLQKLLGFNVPDYRKYDGQEEKNAQTNVPMPPMTLITNVPGFKKASYSLSHF